MVDLEDEGTNPTSSTTRLKPPPRKHTKGNKHNVNKEIGGS
jgi:hypothetical protein